MNIFPLAHQAIRKLALIGILLVPFSLGQAAELVGKPVPVGQSAPASTSAQSVATAPVDPVAPEAPPSPEELWSAENEVHQAAAEMQRDFNRDFGPGFHGFDMSPEIVIPVVAMSLLFGGPVLLLIILALLHYRAKARRQQNINTNIDKLLAAGRDIPVELLLGEEPTAVRRTHQGEVTVYHGADENMRKGVRNIGLGVGWLIFLTIMFGIKIGAFGFILIGLGISQVVIWKLSGPSPLAQPSINNQTSDVSRVQE
jgi:hypothetical protein